MPKLAWDDMAKADDEANKPAPAGTYVIATEKATWGKSKKGADMITLVMRIAEGPFKGKPVWNYLTFDMNNTGATRMARIFLQMSGTDFGDFGKLTDQQQLDFLVGKRYEAELKAEVYQGRPSNKIQSLRKGLSGSVDASFVPPPPAVESDAASPRNPLAGL